MSEEIEDTSILLTVQPDHTYAFYTVAEDFVGHREQPPAVADAEVFVVFVPALTVVDLIDVSPDPRNASVSTVDVEFSRPIDPATFTAADLTLTRDGNPVILDGSVTTSFVSGNTYQITGLDAFTRTEGSYLLTVDATGIDDEFNDPGVGSNSDAWIIDFVELVVDTLVDESDGDFLLGDLSLREAIELANADPGTYSITFDASLDAGTIALTLGEMDVSGNTAIDASSLGSGIAIDAAGNDPTPNVDQGDGSRILNIDDGDAGHNIDVELRGLTFTGGDVTGDGGAIRSVENLTLVDSFVTDNSASHWGGGVYVHLVGGAATIRDSVISGNAANRGGGLYALSYGSTFDIQGSTVADNSAIDHGGGIIANTYIGTSTISGSTISGNTTANYDGAGMRTNTNDGGALTVSDSRFADNISNRYGGGVLSVSSGGTVTISRTKISNNYSGVGGGGISTTNQSAGSNTTIKDTTIAGNTTGGSGGGISDIANPDGTTIIGSTISGNSAGLHGGGIYANAGSTVPTTIRNSTITDNTAGSSGTGAGGGLYVVANGRTPVLDHVIIAGNSQLSGTAADVSGSVDAASAYNLIGVDTGYIGPGNTVQGNQVGTETMPVDTLLGPLTDNGGPTKTHALLPGSPAIDAGDPTAVGGLGNLPQFDQRGNPFLRVAGGRIDMGALEFQDAPLPSADFDVDGDIDGFDFLTWQRGLGTLAPNATKSDGDADNDKDVNVITEALRREFATFRLIWIWAQDNGHVSLPCPLLRSSGRWRISLPNPNEPIKFQTWDQIERRTKRGGLSDDEVRELWSSLFLDWHQVQELLVHVQQFPAILKCAQNPTKTPAITDSGSQC